MGHLGEFPLTTRVFLKAYRWREIDPVPWSPLRAPLSRTSVALITTAGLVLPSQEPFDENIKGGDYSYRVVPTDTDIATLIDTHRSRAFDHRGMHEDANLAFPLDRLRELERERRIGRVAPRHLSFMGSITAPGRLIRDSAPAAARLVVEDGVGVVLLVPVWPMCNQTVCLIAAELERQGVSTVCLILLQEVAERVKPPRALALPFRHGYPLGKPNDVALQRRVIEAALALLDEPGPPPVLRTYA